MSRDLVNEILNLELAILLNNALPPLKRSGIKEMKAALSSEINFDMVSRSDFEFYRKIDQMIISKVRDSKSVYEAKLARFVRSLNHGRVQERLMYLIDTSTGNWVLHSQCEPLGDLTVTTYSEFYADYHHNRSTM